MIKYTNCCGTDVEVAKYTTNTFCPNLNCRKFQLLIQLHEQKKDISTVNKSATTDESEQLMVFGKALDGDRGYEQRAIAQIGLKWITTILRKNHDYGGSVFKSPLLAPNLPATSAIDVRLSDKIERITTLLKKPAEVADESIDDTFTDLGAYCLLRQVAKFIAKPE